MESTTNRLGKILKTKFKNLNQNNQSSSVVNTERKIKNINLLNIKNNIEVNNTCNKSNLDEGVNEIKKEYENKVKNLYKTVWLANLRLCDFNSYNIENMDLDSNYFIKHKYYAPYNVKETIIQAAKQNIDYKSANSSTGISFAHTHRHYSAEKLSSTPTVRNVLANNNQIINTNSNSNSKPINLKINNIANSATTTNFIIPATPATASGQKSSNNKENEKIIYNNLKTSGNQNSNFSNPYFKRINKQTEEILAECSMSEINYNYRETKNNKVDLDTMSFSSEINILENNLNKLDNSAINMGSSNNMMNNLRAIEKEK